MTYPIEQVKYEDCKNVLIYFMTDNDPLELSLDDDEYTALTEALDCCKTSDRFNFFEVDSWVWTCHYPATTTFKDGKWVEQNPDHINKGFQTFIINLNNISFVTVARR